MIIKKLRNKNDWSQEQLAEYSGLNVRTIQRVEGGSKASIETLKCLASVFEVDYSILTEEIVVIDKEADKWKNLPWWFKANMFGVKTRKAVIRIELVMALAACFIWFTTPDSLASPIMFLSVYASVWIVRYGDKRKVW